jgi:hypothetical protein
MANKEKQMWEIPAMCVITGWIERDENNSSVYVPEYHTPRSKQDGTTEAHT